jgi:arylsulfatase A-like enzyme
MKAIVLEIPGLHLGYLGCYGNEWIATPAFDELAAAGVVFDSHFADCPAAALRSGWSGRYDFPNLPTTAAGSANPQNPLFASLQAHGVSTHRIEPTSGKLLAHEKIMMKSIVALKKLAAKEAWLMWVELPSLAPPWRKPKKVEIDYFDEEAADDEDELTPWYDAVAGALNLDDDADFVRLQRTYATVVTALDSHFGAWLDELNQLGFLEDTLLCVTANRGLALGEHGFVGDCRPWPYEEFAHVPLLFHWPKGCAGGSRVSALTQPVDLMPTLLDAFGAPSPDVHGKSLLPLLRGEVAQTREYACTGIRLGEAVEWSLRTRDWAYILPANQAPNEPPRAPQLYVKPDDRWEVNDVAQHHWETVEQLERLLHGFVAATRAPGPFQPPKLSETIAATALAPTGGNPL